MTTWKVRLLGLFPLSLRWCTSWNIAEFVVSLIAQSKIAAFKNASSEDHVSESDLQLGLLAYPVLQAADILIYK
jgi:tryptophanyl-tRNA synthetase